MKILKILGYILLALIGLIILLFAIFIMPNMIFNGPDDIGDYIELAYDKMDVAGIAVGIIDDDSLESFYSYGKMDIENNSDINEDTIFQIASISKTVTGCAVMQLVEQEKLDLDRDINDYIFFDIFNPNFKNEIITVRNLLTHTSSIADNWEVYDQFYTISSGGGDCKVTLSDFVQGYFMKDGKYYDAEQNFLDKPPATAHVYSNCGYALLGYIVETVSGMPFNEYCNQNIFEPLAMNNTAWMISELDESKIAVPYSGGKPLPHYGFATYPDGTLRTSVGDFQKFISMMMNNGTYNGVQILKEETVKQILSPQIDNITEDFGLTWYLKSTSELLINSDGIAPGHSGGDPGITTFVFFAPNNNKGVICFVNSDMKITSIATYRQLIKSLYEEIS